ncbi:MAG: serine/threonine-protein kinase [Gemmatimonadaceae bacterium]
MHIPHRNPIVEGRLRDLVLEQLQVALTGRYEPDRALGHGAMASVYLARDLKHQRLVAIKALRLMSEDPAAVERFHREIAYLAKLQHPHILPLFDSGDALGMPYYVTSYVEGETLRARMKALPNGQLPMGEALRFTREIADALDYAHGHNILHRDVKPENILLADDHALVADFGIARAIQLMGEDALTDTGVAIGTPAYMSPEQLAADRQLDARSDTYSLACVLYEMITGDPPFMGTRGVVENANKFIDVPALLSSAREGVTVQIEKATRRALASDPADRFASAGEFVAALDRRAV